jgi:hypothetical protein
MPTYSTADLTLGNPVMAIGWPDGKPKANACGESKAGQPFTQSMHVLVRGGSVTANLPAGCVSMFFDHPISSFAGRLTGLNELHPTMDDIKVNLGQTARRSPRVAYDTVHNAARQAKVARLDTLVQKQTGDGSLGVGDNT